MLSSQQPTPTTPNTNNQQAQQQSPNSTIQQPNQSASRQATGVVTKILDNFGFIDDSIFFPLSAVKGSASQIKVGDKVYFECTFSQNLPFKWNASFVQLVKTPIHPHPQQPAPTPSPAAPYQPQPAVQHPHQQPPPHLRQAPPHQLQQPIHHQQQSSVVPSAVAPNIHPQLHHQQQPQHHPQHQPTAHQQPYQQPTTASTPGNNSVGSTPPSSQTSSSSSSMYHHHQASPGQYPGYHPQQPQQQQKPPGQPQQPPQYPGYHPQQQFAPHGMAPPPTSAAGGSVVVNNAVVGGAAGATTASAAQPPPQVDMAKVQQAVAQLAPFLAQQQGQQRPPGQPQPGTGPQGLNTQPYGGQGQLQGAGGPGGQPPPGSIQYTSTPGSAFISGPYNNAPAAGNAGGPKPPMGSQRTGRWDHPRDDGASQMKMRRDDPRTAAGRFAAQQQQQQQQQNKPPQQSRFNDSDSRFGQAPSGPPGGQPPMMNNSSVANNIEDRFAPNFPPNLQPGDHQPAFQHRDPFPRKDAANNRDKDFRDRGGRGRQDQQQNRNSEQNKSDRRNDSRRDRNDRDRSKRSISPSNSVASSHGGRGESAARSTSASSSSHYDFLPKGRRYEPINLPKTTIVKKTYNQTELKNRLGGSVHIPSDLKQIIYNDVDTDFDVFHMPKPIHFKIHRESDSKKDSKSSKSSSDKDKDQKSDKDAEKKETPKKSDNQPDDKGKTEQSSSSSTPGTQEKTDESNKSTSQDDDSKMDFQIEEDSQSRMLQVEKEQKDDDEEKEQASVSQESSQSKTKVENSDESQEQQQQEENKQDKNSSTKSEKSEPKSDKSDRSSKKSTSSKSTSPASNKYNVKVLLIALPSLTEIYERLYGQEFASYGGFASSGSDRSSSSRNSVSHFHKLLSMLVQRNSNDGFSLIGGKFQKDLDGFLDPGTNLKPNLVRTAIRIVWEQCQLNLSACRQWRVFSTFIYNRDNCFDPYECGYEITKIMIPDIWSAVDTMYQPLGEKALNKDNNKDKVIKEDKQENDELEDSVKTVKEEQDKSEPIMDKAESVPSTTLTNNNIEDNIFIKDVPNGQKRDYLLKIQANMSNYKVAELKVELDKFDVRYESRWKKEQLFQRLQEVVQSALNMLDPNANDPNTVDMNIAKPNDISMEQDLDGEQPSKQVKETNESESEQSLTNHKDQDETTQESKLDQNKKRKIEETATESDRKKLKTEQEKDDSPPSLSQIKVRGHHLSTVTLHSALNPHRFDQFELIVVAELLRDSLLKHFAGYIHSAILYQIQQQKPLLPAGGAGGSGGSIAPNYCHLAFSYFDRGHSGYFLSDDLNQLWMMTGMEQSKKSFQALIGQFMALQTPPSTDNKSHSSSSSQNERIMYMFFQQPQTFTLMPQLCLERLEQQMAAKACNTGTTPTLLTSIDSNQPLIVERNSIQFNVDELIRQSEQDQKLKVTLQDSLNSINKQYAQLKKHVEELEQKQKKMSAATSRQNDELCAVKRERDQLKSKFERQKKFLLNIINDCQSFMKTFEPTPAPTTAQPPVAEPQKPATQDDNGQIEDKSQTNSSEQQKSEGTVQN